MWPFRRRAEPTELDVQQDVAANLSEGTVDLRYMRDGAEVLRIRFDALEARQLAANIERAADALGDDGSMLTVDVDVEGA
jgi:hypothetical protein